MTGTPNPSYSERSVQKFHEALRAEFDIIRAKHKQLKTDMECLGHTTVEVANLCREIGLHLQTACNHEQINLDFWNNNDCEKQLGFDFNAAKIYIAIARKLPKKIKSPDEAAPFVQLLFQAGGLLELEERGERQNRITVSVMQKFLAEVTIVRKDFEKVVRQIPIADWSETMRQSFIADTQWIQDRREEVKAL
jgi:hypothetical protein